MKYFLSFVLGASLATSVLAQDGTVTAGSSLASDYSCDSTTCVLPDCFCASTSIPGGLTRDQTPQFITLTADDAVQSYTIEVLNYLLGNRTNPNGCTPRSTYFTSLAYTNYSMITELFVAGHEIADHTITHAGAPNSSEILGNIQALNAFAGIPEANITGFRAPYLNFTVETLQILSNASFTYDSSVTSSVPVNETGTDAFWPYTLDNGLAGGCDSTTCGSAMSVPGLWEIPMYGIFDDAGESGIHLMDPWLDADTGASNTSFVDWLKNTFTAHYENNRQPFGLYTHPIHLAVGYPGLTDPIAMRESITEFLDWAQAQENVWIVTNEQLLAWIKNPVPVDQMANSTIFQCQTPVVDGNICNGIPANEQGLLLNCPFSDFPWMTCYGCPVSQITVDNPVPEQNTTIGVRTHISDNCSTAFWDPVAAVCLCTDASCAFTDAAKAVVNTSSLVSSSAAATVSGSATGTATGTASASASSQVSGSSLTAASFSVALLSALSFSLLL